MRIALVAIVAVASCTSDGSSPDLNDGPLVEVATSTSTSGTLSVSVLAHTTKLTRGDYDLEYVITNASDGTPVDGVALTIEPWMPAMGHGTPIVPTITALGSGVYSLEDVDLFMPGLWQLRTSMTTPSDQIEPSLQID